MKPQGEGGHKSPKDRSPNSTKIVDADVEHRHHESDEYDDRWDYLYDDIDNQKYYNKLRRSEKKEDRRNNKYN